MRRVRQSVKGLSAAPFGRMSAAVALSAALHVVLIYGFSLPVISDSGMQIVVIHARVKPAHSSAVPRRFIPRERNRAPEVLPPAAEPASAADPLAEPPALPIPVAEQATEPVAAADDNSARPTIPDPVDYLAKDLDIYPRALAPIAPAYPQTARDAQRGGYVTLLVSIDEVGRVVATSVVDATPDGIFEQAALKALSDTTFYPARKNGRVVRSRILVKVEFDPAMAGIAQ